jgi:hypothetical protein
LSPVLRQYRRESGPVKGCFGGDLGKIWGEGLLTISMSSQIPDATFFAERSSTNVFDPVANHMIAPRHGLDTLQHGGGEVEVVVVTMPRARQVELQRDGQTPARRQTRARRQDI